jgi:hypothetical protein
MARLAKIGGFPVMKVAIFLAVVILGYYLVSYLMKLYKLDGFRDVSCVGVACAEGEFCQSNKCIKINPAYTNNYFAEGFEQQEGEAERELPPCPVGFFPVEAGICKVPEGAEPQAMAHGMDEREAK